MRIVVYGAGSVGAFFGGLLARAGRDIHFVARGRQLDAMRADGLRIESSVLGAIAIPRVSVTGRASDLGVADVVLMCVKAHQMDSFVSDLAPVVGPRTLILPLQNGVETDETVASAFGWPRVLSAVVYLGANIDRPGVVSHVASGVIVLGAREGSDANRLEDVRATLDVDGVEVRLADDIQRQRWMKLLWNASFNPVSALTLREPAALLAHPPSRALITGVMYEVVAVARAVGIPLETADADSQIAWTESASAIRTSMMVDRERGRVMEADALVGVVVRKGREHGVPTPFSQTLYALLTAIDRPATA